MIHLGQAATTCPKPVEATEADSREPSLVAMGLGSCVPSTQTQHPAPLLPGLRRASCLFRGRGPGPADGARPLNSPAHEMEEAPCRIGPRAR
jgi:hypothetical protein